MALDLTTLRKLVSLDVNDPLSRFALGKNLYEQGTTVEEWVEAADHLRFSKIEAPEHLATYHVLAQALLRLRQIDEAKIVLAQGIKRVAAAGGGMGRDLGPAMQTMLDGL